MSLCCITLPPQLPLRRQSANGGDGPTVKCPTGSAVLTSAGRLPVRHAVHAVGPVYTVPQDSEPLLASAYRSALALANEHKATSIAFPALSCGLRGYPPGDAAKARGQRICTLPWESAVRLPCKLDQLCFWDRRRPHASHGRLHPCAGCAACVPSRGRQAAVHPFLLDAGRRPGGLAGVLQGDVAAPATDAHAAGGGSHAGYGAPGWLMHSWVGFAPHLLWLTSLLQNLQCTIVTAATA